jgi:hypothetical protein
MQRHPEKLSFAACINKMLACFFSFLLFCQPLYSQDKIVTGLAEQFEQYQVNNLQEKLFVHIDKTFYLSGEILWFKVYAVDGMFNTPSELSKVAYVEIINQEGKAVLQAKIPLDDASGNGSFLISYSIASGNYKLRAYTKWMKNFPADFFYEQQVCIINTLKELNINNSKKAIAYDIQFFPEGGNLVYGLPSKLAYKIVNETGQAVDYKGFLIDRNKDTVAKFSPLKFGMGSFIFTPRKSEQYKAVLFLPDTIIKKDIEGILDQGYVMKLENTDSNYLKIFVHSNITSPNSPVYLFVHTRHSVKNAQQNNLRNGETFFIINKKDLGDGISHFTIFNEAKQPVCERLFFKRPQNKLDISLTTGKTQYESRENVSVELSTRDPYGKKLEADMSVSVFLVDSFQSAEYNHIDCYLMLSSELKGKIDSPEYYFEDPDSEAAEAADNLMLTQGWRRFKWNDVLENKKTFFKYLPELEGQSIDGTVSNKITGEAGNQIKTWLSIPDTVYTFSGTRSKPDGSFSFTIKNVYGLHDVVLQTGRVDSIYKIDVNNPYAETFSSFILPSFSLSGKSEKELIKRSINTQAENVYLTDAKLHRFFPLKTDTTAFYGYPDKQYYLDDYTRFVTMEEVLKEYVLAVRLKKHPDNFQFRVLNIPMQSYFEDDPLALVDGVPVFNTDRIIAMDPLKIKKIEVLARKYMIGNIVCSGIISFKSYQGDLGGYQLYPDATILEYEGLQHQREFYSPVYENKNQEQNSIPDYRNQLYWSPDIKTKADGITKLSFSTSDLKGRFLVVLQGISREGLAGSKAIFINVK